MCTSWPFCATPGTSAGMGPLISAWITAVFPSVGISSITMTRKFGTAFGNARQITSMPPRIGTTLSRPYGAISSQCAICAKTEHAIDVVGIVGSEELLGGRYVVFRVPFHLYAPAGSLLSGTCALIFKPLAERFDLLLRIRREQVLNSYVGRRNQN